MAFVLAFLLIGIFIYGHNNGVDFKVYSLAGHRLLQNLPIYQFADGWSPFKYHPAWAVIFSFFSLLPYAAANFLFNAINLGFWVLAVQLWTRWLNINMKLSSWTFLLLISINALSTEIGFGQVNGFLIWGVTWIFQQIEEDPKSYLRVGIIATLIFTLKLNYSLLLFYLLFRQWKIIWGFAAGIAILHVLTIIGFHDLNPMALYKDWVQLLLTQSSEQYNTFEVQGFLRYLIRHFDSITARWLWIGTLALALGFGLYRHHLVRKNLQTTKQNHFNRAMDASYWLAIVFFFSPLTWWYHILFLYPMAFVLLMGPMPKVFKIPALCSLAVFSCLSYNVVGAVNIIRLKDSMIFFNCALVLMTLFFLVQAYLLFSHRLNNDSNLISQNKTMSAQI